MLIFFALLFIQTRAQLTVKAEMKSRLEMRNGYKALKKSGDDPAFLVSQRSRVSLLYSKSFFSIGFSMQDVRVWGNETLFSPTGVFGDNASLDVNEAWVNLQIFQNVSVKIGRQYLGYDDKRLLSERNWNQHSVAYDAMVLKYYKNGFKADLAFSYNNQKEILFVEPFTDQKIKTLNFLHIEKQFSEKLKISPMIMTVGYNRSDTSKVVYLRGTYGLFVEFKCKGFSSEYSAYYQNGKNKKGQDVSANLLSVRMDYDIWKFRLGVGFTQISGNNPESESDNLFDIFYGTRHRYFGLMDYFSNIPKSTQNGGLRDLFFSVNFEPVPKLKFNADYHLFSLDKKVFIQKSELSGVLGNELDMYFSKDFVSDVNLSGGFSFMFPGENLETLQGIEQDGSKFSNWAWLMLTVKPTLLSGK